MFQVFDQVKMKKNLKGIDTYGISPCILRNRKNDIFIIRKIHEDKTGQHAIRMYGDLSLAYWNPEMFEKVENMEELKWNEKCYMLRTKIILLNWLKNISKLN